jgi:hypothetical protein
MDRLIRSMDRTLAERAAPGVRSEAVAVEPERSPNAQQQAEIEHQPEPTAQLEEAPLQAFAVPGDDRHGKHTALGDQAVRRPTKALWVIIAVAVCSTALFSWSVLGRHSSDPSTSRVSKAQTASTTDLIQGSSQRYLRYTLSGTGSSGSMNLRVTNETDRVWQLEVEVGTKLEPANGRVQNMVVTEAIHVTLHPHVWTALKMKVDCLDISKLPPSSSDAAWRVRPSPKLSSFIACVNNTLDDAKRSDPRNAQPYDLMRPTLLQLGLWSARGASKQQMIDFWEHYQAMSPRKAQQIVAALNPELQVMASQCGSLRSI